VDAAADICATTEDGETILTWATACGKHSTVQLLLERGAIPTARNRRGSTLLHNSLHCAAARRSAAKLELLLGAGLNIEATNNMGETPLLNSQECYPRSKSAARHILHHETLQEECASKGNQACVPGCRFLESDEPVVDLLLSAGADIRARRGSTGSPRDWAASLLDI
jgi:hypothetical protein